LTPFIQQLTFRDYDEAEEDIGLIFDPAKFKANKQVDFSWNCTSLFYEKCPHDTGMRFKTHSTHEFPAAFVSRPPV
jgi:hypothetical protein